MDINDVISLAIQAADSVLRFRAIAFGSRSFIDLKVFKVAIRVSIRSLSREKGYSEDMPLASVVDLVGTASFRAAKKWNTVADKDNHVDGEWFRHCLCDLVAGVVTEIGHQAHHQLQMRNDHLEFDDEYLDPLGDDDSIIIVQNERGGVQPRSPPSTDDGDSSNYYGFHQGDDAPRPHRPEEVLAPRRQIAEGWKAVNKYAANPFSSTAAAECQDTISSLSRSRKRATSPEINDEREIGAGECVDRNDNDSSNNKEDQEDEDNTSTLNCEVVERVAKRPRLANHDSSLSPATTPSPSHALSARLATRDASGSPRSVTPRKTSIKMLWTKQEEDLLVKSRDQGKTWDEIQDLVSRHTRAACDRKYRILVARRRERNGDGARSGASAVGGRSNDEMQRMPRI